MSGGVERAVPVAEEFEDIRQTAQHQHRPQQQAQGTGGALRPQQQHQAQQDIQDGGEKGVCLDPFQQICHGHRSYLL